MAATDILCTIFPYLSVVDFLSFTAACVGQQHLLVVNLLKNILLYLEGRCKEVSWSDVTGISYPFIRRRTVARPLIVSFGFNSFKGFAESCSGNDCYLGSSYAET